VNKPSLFVGNRRVPIVVGLPIVLLCGVTGALLQRVSQPYVSRSPLEITEPLPRTGPALRTPYYEKKESPVTMVGPVEGPTIAQQVDAPASAPQPTAVAPPAAKEIKASAGDASDPVMSKVEKQAVERTKRASVRRVRAKARYVAPSRSVVRPARSQGLLSQIPIVGPVVGLLLP
jgi:hypothetical protein